MRELSAWAGDRGSSLAPFALGCPINCPEMFVDIVGKTPNTGQRAIHLL